MIYQVRRRLADRRGASRLVPIFVVLIIIAALIIGWPYAMQYIKESGQLACQTALDSARRKMAADYMLSSGLPILKGTSACVMNGQDNLCPSGGTVYVREIEPETESGLPFELVCGLHHPDTKLRTRLNASYALAQVEDAVAKSRLTGVPFPESVTVSFNDKTFTASLVDETTIVRRGTDYIQGLSGTVIYYSIVGHSEFGDDAGLEKGRVWYFSFADENHCANWSSKKSWTGDSYE